MVRGICQGRVATLGGPCRNLSTSGAVHQAWKMNKVMHNENILVKKGYSISKQETSGRQLSPSWHRNFKFSLGCQPRRPPQASPLADASARGVYSRLNACKRSKTPGPESRDFLYRSSLCHGVRVTSLRDGGSVMQRYRVRGEAPGLANLVAFAHELTVPIATYPLASRNEAHPNNRTRRYARIKVPVRRGRTIPSLLSFSPVSPFPSFPFPLLFPPPAGSFGGSANPGAFVRQLQGISNPQASSFFQPTLQPRSFIQTRSLSFSSVSVNCRHFVHS